MLWFADVKGRILGVARQLPFTLFLSVCIILLPGRGISQIAESLTNYQQHVAPLYSEFQPELLQLPPLKDKRMIFTVHRFPDSQGNAYIIQNEGASSDTVRVHSAAGVTHAGLLNEQDIFFIKKEAGAEVVIVSENDLESRVDLVHFIHDEDSSLPLHTASFSVSEYLNNYLNNLVTTFLGSWNYGSDVTEFDSDKKITVLIPFISRNEEQMTKANLIKYVNSLYQLIDIISGNIILLIAPEKYQSQRHFLGEQPAASVLCPLQFYPCDAWLDGPSAVHKKNWDEIFGHSPRVRKSPTSGDDKGDDKRGKNEVSSGSVLLTEAANPVNVKHNTVSFGQNSHQQIKTEATEAASDYVYVEADDKEIQYTTLSHEIGIHPFLLFVINSFITYLIEKKENDPKRFLSENHELMVVMQAAIYFYKETYEDEEATIRRLDEALEENFLHFLVENEQSFPELVNKYSKRPFLEHRLSTPFPSSSSSITKPSFFEQSLFRLVLVPIQQEESDDKKSKFYSIKLFILMLKLFLRDERDQSKRVGLMQWLDNTPETKLWRRYVLLIAQGHHDAIQSLKPLHMVALPQVPSGSGGRPIGSYQPQLLNAQGCQDAIRRSIPPHMVALSQMPSGSGDRPTGSNQPQPLTAQGRQDAIQRSISPHMVVLPQMPSGSEGKATGFYQPQLLIAQGHQDAIQRSISPHMVALPQMPSGSYQPQPGCTGPIRRDLRITGKSHPAPYLPVLYHNSPFVVRAPNPGVIPVQSHGSLSSGAVHYPICSPSLSSYAVYPAAFWKELFKNSFQVIKKNYPRISVHSVAFWRAWKSSFSTSCQKQPIPQEQADRCFQNMYRQWLARNHSGDQCPQDGQPLNRE